MAENPSTTNPPEAEHDWNSAGFCKRCALAYAQVWRVPYLKRCHAGVVGIASRAVQRKTEADANG